jgi:pimeloyl-ACP methyl ester carboxylesterase
MKTRTNLSEWKNPEAEARFRAMEDELAAELLAEPPTAVDVPTRLGPTRVYRWPGAGEPVLLLHGTSGTAYSWGPYVEQRGDRAYDAVDTMGDVGRSRQEVAVESADDLADWLAETLDGLGLDRVHLVGTSYGGFLALNLAARRPDRVRSLFLIEPAAIERFRLLPFMLWGTSALFASWLPKPLRMAAARRLRMPLLEDPRLMRFALFGQLRHRTRLLRPEPLTDDQLRSIGRPVHLVLGAKSEVFPAAAVRHRAEELLSDVTVDVVDDAGHAVSFSHLDLVTARLATFLAQDGRIGRPPRG